MVMQTLVLRAEVDGQGRLIVEETVPLPPGPVVVILAPPSTPSEAAAFDDDTTSEWANAAEAAFAQVWENDDDAIYDRL